MKTLDLASVVRKDFPILKEKINGKPLIYLDSAATSQKPQDVIDAICRFYTHDCGTVHRGVYHLSTQATQKYHAVREKIGDFIGASSPREILFTKGTTDGINLVAANFRGKKVILTEMEHHSNIVPWQLHGAEISYIPVNERAELNLEAFEELLTEDTAVVSVAHIANSTGTINEIKTIIDQAHAKGALVLIDAAQSPAHVPVDVEELGCDFLAFSSHKAFGPTGLGILYCKEKLLKELQPVQGGGDMVDQVSLETTTYGEPPLRFEAGTPPIAQVIGFGAAIDYIQKLGLENIQSHEDKLLMFATQKLVEIEGLRILGEAKNKSSIISFVIEGIHHLDLATYLDLEGIAIRSGNHCAQPLLKRFSLTGTNRISFAPFNTLEEIDSLITSLKKAVPLLK